MQRLKGFVVRQLADALSDYVEGITPETVQASLGADTGALDLKARINPAVLRPLGLDLNSSAVDLHVSIPWRHLESQPCVFEVRSLVGEVSLRPPGALAVCDLSPERARADKEAAVAKLEAAEAARQAGDQGMAPGRVARASHAILRQLQASIHGVHIQLDRKQWAQPPVHLGLESVQLQSVGSDWKSAPDRDSGDLFKIFQLRGLELREDQPGPEKILGPVAIEAKLHHAASERMAHLELGTLGDTPAELRPGTVQLACRCLASVLASRGHGDEGDGRAVTLSEEAGRDYAKLYTRKLRGEAVSAEELQRIEDLAPAEWIAAWRVHVRKLQKESDALAASRPSRKSWAWTSWVTGSRGQGPEDQQEPMAMDDFLSGATAESLLDDAIGAGLVPEVELPMEIKVDFRVWHVELKCIGSSSSLRFDVQDAVCSVEIKARSPACCQTTTHLWDVDGRAHLASLTVQLGSERTPLVELPGAGLVGGGGESEHALDMRLEISQRDALVSGSPPFDARLTMKKKAILVRLASWRVHGVLATAVDIASPLLEWCREGDSLLRPAGERFEAPALPPLDSGAVQQAGASAASSFTSVASESSAEATVKIDVSIQAPILHWEVPHREGGVREMRFCSGKLRARTRSPDSAAPDPMWSRMPDASEVSLAAFGCACELTETSAVLVRSSGDQLSVYELPNLRLQLGLEPSGATSVRVASNTVRLHVNSELTKFLGQSRTGLDYAIAPLARLGAGATPAAPAASPAPQQPRDTRVPAERAVRELRVDVDFQQFQICLGNALLPAASLSFGHTTVEVAQISESLDVTASLEKIGVISSEHTLVDCARVAVKVSSVPATMETELTIAPLGARWAATPARRALQSAQEAARGYGDGKKLASQEQPPSDDGSALSLYLWNVYVKERAEKLGENAQTYMQQELGQLGLGAAEAARATPSSSQVSLVRFKCEELRLSIEPDAPATGRQPAALNALGTSGDVRWEVSGLKGAFSLDSVSLDLGSRRILSPKQARGKLLDVSIGAGRGQPPTLRASWAQVVAVYLQRDLDSLMDLVQADVVEVLSPAAGQGTGGASPAPAAAAPTAPAAGGGAIARLEYNLSIQAPLVFLPVPAPGTPVARLALEGEEVEFKPDAHQEFLVVDFGSLKVCQGDAVSEVQSKVLVTLTDARVLTGCGSRRETWRQVVDPLGLGLELTLDGSRFDVRLNSPLNDLDKQHLSLTRPQLTLVLNIAAAFMQQDGGVQPEPRPRAASAACSPSRGVQSEPRPRAASAACGPGRGVQPPQGGAAAPAKQISFAWVWKGPLTFDMSFTEEAPLAKLELRGGDIKFCSGAEGSKLEVRCKSPVVQDARRSARNADKAALRCAPQEPGAFGLQVVISMPPPSSTDGGNTIEVDLNRPILLVLPQWFMDLSTWSLSGYQHSALAALTAPARPADQPPAGVASQHVVVRAPGAAVRAPVRWQDPSDVFELAADVSLDLTQIPGETRFDEAKVTNGKLCRAVRDAEPLPLSSKLELCANGGSFTVSEHLDENWRAGQLLLDTVQVPKTDVFLSVADAGALLGMISEISQFDAQSAEPAEELRQRDPLALTVQNKFSLVLTNFEVEGINLQLLEQSQGGWARPALDIGMTAHMMLALQSAAGELPKGSFRAEGVTLEARSFNECIGLWEPILAPSVWKCGCQAKHSHEHVVELKEFSGEALPTRYGAGSVVRAWYGDQSRKWGAEGGKDVTEVTKALLKAGKDARACNKLFGDPCHGKGKVLLVELRREAVLKTHVECGPLQLVVTVPFVSLVNRLLSGSQDSGDSTEQQEVGKRGGMLQALNLSGVECGVVAADGGDREVRLAPGETVPLDALAAGEQLPRLALRLPGVASDQVAVTLEALSSQVWPTRSGDMLVQVLMPDPPQRLLLITSTVSVRNSTPLDAEVRFLRASGEAIEAPAATRHTPAATLQAPKRSGEPVRREASLAAKGGVPRGAQKLRGHIALDIKRATSLGKPAYRIGDDVKRVLPFGSGDYKVYVEVELIASGVQAHTEVVKAPRDRVDISQQLQVKLPEGTTRDLLKGTEIAVRVFNKVSTLRSAIRNDPLIGEATLRLGNAEVSGQVQQHRLPLARKGQPQGHLELAVELRFFSEASPSSSFAGTSASFARSSFLWTPSELDTGELKSWCQKVGVPTQGRERAELLKALEDHRGASGPSPSSASGLPAVGGRETVFRVPAGCILAAPVEAVGPAMSRMQFRPAATGGASFEWGDAVTLADLKTGSDGKMCFAGPAGRRSELPGSYLHLSLRTFGTKLQGCEVRIEAPFSVANGCPCEVLCSLGFWDHPKELGSETDITDARSDVVIADGRGGEWTVSPGGRASIFPLKVAADTGLVWQQRASGEENSEWRERGVVWGEANALLVEREGRTMRWHFRKMVGFRDLDTRAGNPFSIEPGTELPVMDARSEGLLLRVALREQKQGTETTWSNPVPVVVPPGADKAQVTFHMLSGSQPVVLRAVRKGARRIVLYVGTWFVDSTGLGIGISYRPETACVHQFGNSVALLGEESKDDSPQVYLRLPGSREPVGVPVPIMGGSSRVEMSALHECALMVEPIATSSTFGVLCKLMSVVPGLMVFNQLDDRDIGFRQTGCEDMTWVHPGGSSQLYWTRADKNKLVEMALKQPGTNWERAQASGAKFSAPRLISEAGVGAFPMTFQEPTEPKLACLHVDQAGELFSLTVAGEAHCHQLENRHPCLTIRAHFEADASGACTEVPFGSRKPLARRGSAASAGRQQDRLCLELRDSEGPGRPHKMVIDLSRAAVHRVSECAGRASLGGARAPSASGAVPASWVCVDICSRVGIVTVSPVVGASTADTVTWGYDLEVEVKSVGISLIGEKPHSEVFAAELRGLHLKSDLTSTGRRAVQFLAYRLYLDLMRPSPVVVLSSLRQESRPFLQLDVILEDVFARDMTFNKVDLCLTPLEVTVDDTLIQEARKYVQVAVPRALGVDLEAVLERARRPYNLSCGGPPAPSRKFVLHDVQVSQLKLTVFAKLRLDILPDWVYALIFALSGFKDHLQVDGASLKLPEQQLFRGQSGCAQPGCVQLPAAAPPQPFEGNLSAVFEHVQRRYTKLYLKALLSLLNNSNLILGGLLSRHRWHPKNRDRPSPFRLPLTLSDGAIRLADQHLDAFLREDNNLSFPMLRMASSSQTSPAI